MEVIIIDTNNKLNKFSTRLKSKLEDALFTIISKMPEKLIPQFLMNWFEQYTNKRIVELNQQIIHDRWHSVKLEKAVDEIHNRQQGKK